MIITFQDMVLFRIQMPFWYTVKYIIKVRFKEILKYEIPVIYNQNKYNT